MCRYYDALSRTWKTYLFHKWATAVQRLSWRGRPTKVCLRCGKIKNT
jgi:hypothetical protein